ncbi:hypothetical protein [Oceanirhabdus sp. W0125-5]|uniref:hypothetical protein n=1 Tax=Oceanirhabdus sp. W0125-5 TaxID=2999116 RepID=UPI0022F32B83|nr:hypothetical protein [Oceanirhabdus sp. W0125-5]WBW97308.1 hypothetical protein OW730_00200 [Oceanirhabdus sp. W0125-5]
MKRDRYIRVPKDGKAAEDYDYGVQKPSQMIDWILNEEEYYKLDLLEVFNELNIGCNIIIDDFEEEVIIYDKLDKALDIVDKIIIKNQASKKDNIEVLNKLKDMVIYAIENKTIVAFDF